VARDFIGLERRRLAAGRLLSKNIPQAAVARQLGVSRQSVSRWARALQHQGSVGLRRAPVPGRHPRLDARQREVVRRLLQANPGPWALPKIDELIQSRLGVCYHRTRLIQLLHETGFRYRPGTGWVRGG